MNSSARRARLLGMSASTVALACVAVLHVLRPDLPPASRRLSEYAHGPHAWLMAVAFLAAGLALLSAAGVLHRLSGAVRRPSPAVALLVGAATGMVLSAVFRTEPDGAATWVEQAHSLASGAATLAVVSAAWLHSVTPLVRRARGPVDLVTGGVGLTAVVLAAASPVLHQTRWTGLGQRVLWLALMGWLLRVVWCTGGRRTSASAPARPFNRWLRTAAGCRGRP